MNKKIFFTAIIYIFCCIISFASDIDRFSLLYIMDLEELNPQNVLAINSNIDNTNWFEPTPSQGKGPFYPVRMPSEIDTDLTIIGSQDSANGVVVYIQGQIMDQTGSILSDVKIEIWQACASGKYNHPHDSNDAPIDPNFQYYAKTFSDKNGKYIFKTIVPGPYPASPDWWRPPHIHYLISKPGFKTLITQSYFDGDSFIEPVTNINGLDITGEIINNYNSEDYMLNRLDPNERPRLIVSFNDSNIEEEKIKLGVFSIYLEEDI